MWHMEEELQKEGVSVSLLKEIQKFRESHVVDASVAGRVPVPRFLYYGKEIWEEAAAALLCGENLLLSGPKATGKNVLAENLAAAFGKTVLGYFFLCECGCRFPHWNRHIPG